MDVKEGYITNEEKLKYIKEFHKKHNFTYKEMNENQIKLIYNLYKDRIISETDDGMILNYYGLYYKKIEKDYELMKKYYLMAIKKGNDIAMNSLGNYYEKIEKNYDLMKKYYLMAIKKGNVNAMYNLGYYYQNNEKNYDLMKKYYLMAIDKGDDDSMNNLGVYYKEIEKNYDLMKKYYLMAIEKGNSHAMNNLALYYQFIEKNYNESINFFIKYDKKEELKKIIKKLNGVLNKDIINHIIEYFTNKKELSGIKDIIKELQITNENKESIELLLEGIDKENYKFELIIDDNIDITNYPLLNKYSKKDIKYFINEYKKGNVILNFNKDFDLIMRKYDTSKKYNNRDTCGICLEEDILCILTSCYHPYCLDCYVDCYMEQNNKCPTCKQPMQIIQKIE